MRSLLTAFALGAVLTSPAFGQPRPHNVVLFVADGLRPGMVSAQTAPTIQTLMERGVRFTNTHSLFPTFTTANASGMATGYMLGDTGDFSNTIYSGFPVPGAGESLTPSPRADASGRGGSACVRVAAPIAKEERTTCELRGRRY